MVRLMIFLLDRETRLFLIIILGESLALIFIWQIQILFWLKVVLLLSIAASFAHYLLSRRNGVDSDEEH